MTIVKPAQIVEPAQIEPRGVDTTGAANYCALSTSFLEKARINQTKTPGPKFKKIGKRVVYLLDDLDLFLESSE